MSDYQVIARKFRPQAFKEVVGQDPIVTTLKNAIKFNRLAQAYLFCGPRGTGKTTLARILAKALNCQQPLPDGEPCQTCPSCRSIINGASIDVIEIDGASNRGIEDIRQINETVGYAAAGGAYKIYIIDEVHMLTKEAFNALLKTLEEPPPKVKFFFATTEPHKVLPTILSRCQRFNLNRIPTAQIADKLHKIVQQLNVDVEVEALLRLAQRSEGGMRDAESLLDQVLAFTDGRLTLDAVNSILGLMPRETFFEIDRAGKEANLAKAFEIAHRIFAEGKDLSHFLEGLVDHYRTILLIKLSGPEAPYLSLSVDEKERYVAVARIYSQEQLLELIDFLIESQQQIRSSSFGKMALEAILLRVMRSHYRLSVGQLVARLNELEQNFSGEKPSVEPKAAIVEVAVPAPKPIFQAPKPVVVVDASVSEDPTPTLADLGKKSVPPVIREKKETPPPPLPKEDKLVRQTHEYDTLMQFAAVELEGRLQRT